MSKQQEIEQGFCERLDGVIKHHDKGGTITRETAKAILSWLSSKGVVLKINSYTIEPLITEEGK